jgi:4'-phosphopantetheinyl transferase EntD
VPAERDELGRHDRERPSVHWGRLLFSAKESIYKAWYPLTGRWLGFEEADLTIDPVAQTFTAHILANQPPLAEMHGRFRVSRGLVVTAVTVR